MKTKTETTSPCPIPTPRSKSPHTRGWPGHKRKSPACRTSVFASAHERSRKDSEPLALCNEVHPPMPLCCLRRARCSARRSCQSARRPPVNRRHRGRAGRFPDRKLLPAEERPHSGPTALGVESVRHPGAGDPWGSGVPGLSPTSEPVAGPAGPLPPRPPAPSRQCTPATSRAPGQPLPSETRPPRGGAQEEGPPNPKPRYHRGHDQQDEVAVREGTPA